MTDSRFNARLLADKQSNHNGSSKYENPNENMKTTRFDDIVAALHSAENAIECASLGLPCDFRSSQMTVENAIAAAKQMQADLQAVNRVWAELYPLLKKP